ncbi:TetR/AcrR family transcriptional regulator [Sandaracinus amylolyticus]|uniref:TetR/AcrR family transcriptional regulator n=1 Tax=Sandaracinus amylolyticus TaxID=927083 RepID=UPI001F4550C4|nr:TetR/AcrR family transcriptional regulator [Sandaracinus amylolyticus]
MTSRERILDGAARAFGRLGYARTRVEDVLNAADVSRPTFYKEFSSADDVFETLARLHFRELSKRLVDALESTGDPSGKLFAIVDAYFRWRSELGPLGRVLDVEARQPRSALARIRRPVTERLVEAFREQIVALGRPAPDPLLLGALISAAEHLGDTLPSDRAPTAREMTRRRIAMLRLAAGVLMPLEPERKRRRR